MVLPDGIPSGVVLMQGGTSGPCRAQAGRGTDQRPSVIRTTSGDDFFYSHTRMTDDAPCAFFFGRPFRRRPVLYRAPERKVFATPRSGRAMPGTHSSARDARTATARSTKACFSLSAGSARRPSRVPSKLRATRAFVVRRCRLSGLSEAQTATRGRGGPARVARRGRRVRARAHRARRRRDARGGRASRRRGGRPGTRAPSRVSRVRTSTTSPFAEARKSGGDDDDDDDVSEDDDDDVSEDDDVTPSMSDLEATRALETALGVHMDASAACHRARLYGDKTRPRDSSLIVGRARASSRAGARGVPKRRRRGFHVPPAQADSIFLGGTMDAVDAATSTSVNFDARVWIKPICEVWRLPSAASSPSSLAHAIIFTTFLANAFVLDS